MGASLFSTRCRNAVLGAAFGLMSAAGVTGAAQAGVIVTLGEQDFEDGELVVGSATYNIRQIGEPAPFDIHRGNDGAPGNVGQDFSESFTFNFIAPSNGIKSARLTLGMYDHDSAAPGNQVDSFSLDGLDITSVLSSEVESRGGTQNEYNIYEILLPSSTLSALLDGVATFALTMQGPGLFGLAGTTADTTAFDSLGLDFATLSITDAPEPGTTALMASALLGLLGFRGRRRKGRTAA